MFGSDPMAFKSLLFFISVASADWIIGPNNGCPEIEDEILDYSLNDFDQADPKLIEVLQQKYLIKPSGKPLNLSVPVSNKLLKGQYGQSFFLDDSYFKQVFLFKLLPLAVDGKRGSI
jgi:hypothetical protein